MRAWPRGVVDLGRPDCRRLGVALGGAADRAALALGNALVGNASERPALEICLKGPVLRAETRLGGVLYGAPFPLTSARQQLRPGLTFTLEAGEEIHIGGVSRDLRAYLCVPGGLRSPEILGSFSSLENVKAGEVLPCEESTLRRRFFSPAFGTNWGKAEIYYVWCPGSRRIGSRKVIFTTKNSR